jgi:hypothetical protein
MSIITHPTGSTDARHGPAHERLETFGRDILAAADVEVLELRTAMRERQQRDVRNHGARYIESLKRRAVGANGLHHVISNLRPTPFSRVAYVAG